VRIPRAPAIFGFADGLVCAMGIVAGMVIIHATPRAIWAAAFSAGLAEMAGMAAGQYESAPEDGKLAAMVCGLASTAGAMSPAVPYLVTRGGLALGLSLGVTVVLCLVIAWLRPDHGGWRAVVQSLGITTAAVGLCLLGGLIPG
jgi:VIT1/CCC1 family predicted Fe2+/Mn2+ transporter